MEKTVNKSISIGKTLIKNESAFTNSERNYGITTCFDALENTL